MLTSDLVRVRRRDKKLVPLYLRGDDAARARAIAAAMIDVLRAMVGRARDEVEAGLAAVPVSVRDRVVALGLEKLLEDRSTYEVAAGVDPEAIRREVFLAAATAHRELDVKGRFARDAVLAEVGARLGTPPAALEAGLYADLRGSEVLRGFRPIGPDELVERYNVALAQAVLLRAVRVEVLLEGETPARYREVFRAARFHGLLHVVGGDPSRGYALVVDGPMSLFDSVQRYGLKLALFLPSVLACRRYHVRADVRWGKSRDRLAFEIGPEDRLVPAAEEPSHLSPELAAFCEAFAKLGSSWTVAPNERIFALPGEVVCVPDLVFSDERTGEEVFLEAFGFWSRAAVWNRVEAIRKGFPARILLAVGKQLRVSEEVLGEEDAGELYVYRATMSPRAVLERLEAGPRGVPGAGRKRRGSA